MAYRVNSQLVWFEEQLAGAWRLGMCPGAIYLTFDEEKLLRRVTVTTLGIQRLQTGPAICQAITAQRKYLLCQNQNNDPRLVAAISASSGTDIL